MNKVKKSLIICLVLLFWLSQNTFAISLASQQDTQTKSDNSYNWSVSAGFSSLKGLSGAATTGETHGNGSSTWTNSVSKLVGSEDVQGNIQNLNLTAGQVYVQNAEGVIGQASLTTAKLNLTDLKDTNSYNSDGYNIGLSTGAKDVGGLTSQAKATVGISQSGYTKEGLTNSFVGAGVNIGAQEGAGTLASNLDSVQKITKDEQRQGISFDTSVINEITDTTQGLQNLGKTGTAISRVGDAVSDMADSASKGGNVLKDYQSTVKLNQSRIDLRNNNSAAVDEINGKGKGDAAAKQEATQALADAMTDALGKPSTTVSLADSNQIKVKQDQDGTTKAGAGMSDDQSNNVVLNIDKTNLTDTKDTVQKLAHEIGHQVDPAGVEISADRTKDIVDRAWERENKYEGVSGTSGTNETQSQFYQENKDSQVVKQGTQVLEGIQHGQADIDIVYGNIPIKTIKTDKYDLRLDAEKITNGALTIADAFALVTTIGDGIPGDELAWLLTRKAVKKGVNEVVEKGVQALVEGATNSQPKLLPTPSKASVAADKQIAPYYPTNQGFQGTSEKTVLMPGDLVDRYGSSKGKFLSPVDTPLPMRALPPNANTSVYKQYEVVKPFEVEAGKIAPAYGQIGQGIQYLPPVNVETLVKRGIIKEKKSE